MSFDFEKVFEDAFISIEVDDQLKFIQIVWLQHPDSVTFRQGFARAAEISLSRNCHFWLSDSRAVHYLEFAEQNWILDRMAPLLGHSCLTKFARVNSPEGLDLLDMDRILYGLELSPHVKSDFEIAVFMDKQQALNWLFPRAESVSKPLMQKQAGVLTAPINMLR